MKIPFIGSSDSSDENVTFSNAEEQKDNSESEYDTDESVEEYDTDESIEEYEDEQQYGEEDSIEEYDTDESVEEHDEDDNSVEEDSPPAKYELKEDHLESISTYTKEHAEKVAPYRCREESSMMHMEEDHYTRTLFVNSWPRIPEDGYLQKIFQLGEYKVNVSMHLSHVNMEDAKSELNSKIDQIQTDINRAEDSLRSKIDHMEEIKRHDETLLKALENGTHMFMCSMYFVVKGNTKEEVEQSYREIARYLRVNADLAPEIPRFNQLEAFKSSVPLVQDELDTKINNKHPLPSGAVASIFPFTTKYLDEDESVEIGIHNYNYSPLFASLFKERENGYNHLKFGKIGSGKTFSTNLLLLRAYAKMGDQLELFVIDPKEDFTQLLKLLDGQEIRVGGTDHINPMNVTEAEMKDEEGKSKIKMLIDQTMTFLSTHFEDVSEPPEQIERAIRLAYTEEAGIKPDDPSTFSKKSPCIQDELLTVLNKMSENPEEYISGYVDDSQINKFKSVIDEWKGKLEVFNEGERYENLGGRSSVQFDDSPFTYINTSLLETGGAKASALQLLLTQIYDHAKSTDKKVMLVMDEAHVLLNDQKSKEYLAYVTRHSRHADLALMFLTQEVKDFYKDDEYVQTIQANTVFKHFHLVENIPEKAKEKDLEPHEIQYITNANPGSPENPSQCLIQVDKKGKFPALIKASPFEINLLTDQIDIEEAETAEGVAKQQKQIEEAKESEDYNPEKFVEL